MRGNWIGTKPLLLAAPLALAGLAVGMGSGAARATDPAGEAPTAMRGEQVFDRWCAPCHAQGSEYPGTSALQAKYRSSVPAALEDRTDLTPALIRYFVRNGVSIMPRSRKTEISDADLDALALFLTQE